MEELSSDPGSSTLFGSTSDDDDDDDGDNDGDDDDDDYISGSKDSEMLSGGEGNDVLCGRGGEDTLLGGNGNDTLLGGKGHDTLLGGAGNDILKGVRGNDKLSGGDGTDTLTGGKGMDIFFFDGTLELGEVDTITDFNKVQDKIDLTEVVSLEIGEDINDYVQIVEASGDTVITVDETGSGDFSVDNEVFLISGIIGLGDAQAMLDNDQMQVDQS